MTISNCLIIDNWTGGHGGAIYCNTDRTTIVSCLIAGNHADAHGGGVFFGNSRSSMELCTLSNNSARKLGGGVARVSQFEVSISSCVLWRNQAAEGFEIAVVNFGSNGALSVDYTDVRGGREGIHVGSGQTLNWGEGNIDEDPRFVDPAGGDFHLSSGSSCIDSGDPLIAPAAGETDIDGQTRLWNDRVDMGADEFGSFVVGDINCDGVVDAFDIEPFLLVLFDPAGYEARFPDCDRMLADLNFDGQVDPLDIESFLDVLFP